MTDCSADLTISPLSHKPVVFSNNGGALTSDAGMLLLRQLDEWLGWTRRLAGCATICCLCCASASIPSHCAHRRQHIARDHGHYTDCRPARGISDSLT